MSHYHYAMFQLFYFWNRVKRKMGLVRIDNRDLNHLLKACIHRSRRNYV